MGTCPARSDRGGCRPEQLEAAPLGDESLRNRITGNSSGTSSPVVYNKAAQNTATVTAQDLEGFDPALTRQLFGWAFAGQPLSQGAREELRRQWELAGTAHADAYMIGVGFGDLGTGAGAVQMFQLMRTPNPPPAGCASPINAGGHHWTFQAALHGLDTWVRTGTPPAAGMDASPAAEPVWSDFVRCDGWMAPPSMADAGMESALAAEEARCA